MDFSIYFEAIDSFQIDSLSKDFVNSIGSIIKTHTEKNGFPDISKAQLAIVGVPEERGSNTNNGCCNAPDAVRNKLYKLKKSDYSYNIIDLGNLKKGHTLNDTYFALSSTCSELIKLHIIPIIIGGSQDLTYSQYCAYQNLEQTVNIAAIDAFFDLGDINENISSESYLGKIIMREPSYLFNFSNIGYQTYFVGQDAIDLMKKLYFDIYRLGEVRASIEEVEPIVRNADIVTFDVSSIRQSDAPGNANASPNGFYGEEACQMVKYAGLSDKLSSIGFYEINPLFDKNNQTSHLAAQMIWYFIDGFYNRKKDFPLANKRSFTKYRVAIKNTEHEIIFYKSMKSDRWWMEVPYVTNKNRYHKHHLVPCSYKDYQTACNEDMPDRWWQAFQKLS